MLLGLAFAAGIYDRRRKLRAGLQHEAELADMREKLGELQRKNNGSLARVLALIDQFLPLAELADNNGRAELFWQQRAALRTAFLWAEAIEQEPDCAQSEFNDTVLLAIKLMRNGEFDEAFEVLSELWLSDEAPLPVKAICLQAQIEMRKAKGYYDEAARLEGELEKLRNLGPDEQASFEIN
jgi:hypothetical protein